MDLASFTEELCTSMSGGNPITVAISSAASCSRGSKARALRAISEDLSQGAPFYAAIARHPQTFSSDFVTLMRVAEESGRLAETLPDIARRLGLSKRMGREIRESLTYPVFVLILAILGALYLGISVLPQVHDVLTRLGAPVPGLAGRIMALVGSLSPASCAIGFAFLLVGICLARIPRVKPLLRNLASKLPIVGDGVQSYMEAQFFNTLLMCLGAGMSFHRSLAMALDVSGLVGKDRAATSVKDAMAGIPADEIILSLRRFRGWQEEIIRRGLTTGTLQESLETLSRIMDEEAVHKARKSGALLGPMFILLPGCLVGVLAYAVVTSIYASISVSAL